MSVYGMIIVGGDYEGRIEALTKVLNDLNLHDDDDRSAFQKHKNKIEMNTGQQEFPTVFPLRSIMVFEDGRRIDFREASDRLIKEYEESSTLEEYEEYTLQMLSEMIAPLITKGTLELVAVGHDACMRDVYYGRLLIRSDRSAERHLSYSHHRDGTKIVSERFDPNA
jgi:hypothetical protein